MEWENMNIHDLDGKAQASRANFIWHGIHIRSKNTKVRLYLVLDLMSVLVLVLVLVLVW
jgi:hypothetical protein